MTTKRTYEASLAAFQSMGDGEWQGLLLSLANGGVLEPDEQRAFEEVRKARALNSGRPSFIPAKTEVTKEAPKNVAEMATKLKVLKDRKEKGEEVMSQINKDIDLLSRELAEAMETQGVTSFKVADVGTVYITPKYRPHIQDKQAFIKWLDETGQADMAQRTVHPKRLESLAKEMAEEGRQFPKLPNGTEVVSVFVQKCATIRRK